MLSVRLKVIAVAIPRACSNARQARDMGMVHGSTHLVRRPPTATSPLLLVCSTGVISCRVLGRADSRTARADPYGPTQRNGSACIAATMKHRHFRESSPHDCALALVDQRGSAAAHGRSIDCSPPDGLGGTVQPQGLHTAVEQTE